MGFFSEPTALDVCWFCRGKKYDPYTYEKTGSCPHCAGTGKPTEYQKKQATREIAGTCLDCGLPPGDHHKKGFPDGCLRAALDEIHSLRADLNRMTRRLEPLGKIGPEEDDETP